MYLFVHGNLFHLRGDHGLHRGLVLGGLAVLRGLGCLDLLRTLVGRDMVWVGLRGKRLLS